jgi:hypothetical protein
VNAGRAALLLVLAAVFLVGGKILLAGYGLQEIVPEIAWDVRLVMTCEGHDEPLRLRTFLPRSDERQTVREESFPAGALARTEESQGDNRRATWSAPSLVGAATVSASWRVTAHAARYEIPPGMPIPASPPAERADDTRPTKTVQSDAREIGELLDRIAAQPRTVDTTLRAIFDYTHEKLEPAPFKGTTDALTALRLQQGSCNGKSRLFAALARRAGIPTRLVGGIILSSGAKRTSHQWVESWVNGVWVPFCPLNGHHAEIPARYLRLYTGDEPLFSHSSNINFDYQYGIRRRIVPRESPGRGEAPPWTSTRLWALLGRIGIPLDLLRILVMLPLGATMTVIFRNVVGLRMFGTFLPALLAVACRGTGLAWGLAGFALLLALVGAARWALDRMNLLHTPKLAVMLTLVIFGMLGLSALAVSQGIGTLAYISLFPIAVTTLTTERFAITVQEEGWHQAVLVSGQTALVVAACYLVMDSPAMQSAFLAFPELLLAVLGLDLWLGRWMGLRLVEYRRFSGLVKSDA